MVINFGLPSYHHSRVMWIDLARHCKYDIVVGSEMWLEPRIWFAHEVSIERQLGYALYCVSTPGLYLSMTVGRVG